MDSQAAKHSNAPKKLSVAELIAKRKVYQEVVTVDYSPIFKKQNQNTDLIEKQGAPFVPHATPEVQDTVASQYMPDGNSVFEVLEVNDPTFEMGPVIDVQSLLVAPDNLAIDHEISVVQDEQTLEDSSTPLFLIEPEAQDLIGQSDHFESVIQFEETMPALANIQIEPIDHEVDMGIITEESSGVVLDFPIVAVSANDESLIIDPITGHRILTQTDQVGEFKGIITGLLSDRNKSLCAVLDIGCAEVIIVCVKEFYGTAIHSSLLSTLASVRYDFRIIDEFLASEDIIAKLNSLSARKAQSTRNGEIINHDNRYLVVYDDIVRKAVQLTATDVHFEITDTNVSRVRLRIYGRMKDWKPFSTALLKGALTAAYSKRTKSGTNSAGALSLERAMNTITEQVVNGKIINGRFSGYPLVNGYDVVMRLLDSDPKSNIPTPGALGYSDFHVNEQIMPAIGRNAGLIAISGSTGSGKSTALRAFMNAIPDRDCLKLYSVEDPVEYLSPFLRQISVQRSTDDADEVVKMKFLSTLRSILRMDPDALMLGEIRDHDSASIASEFNRTGHRVFTTVHGDGCVDVLARLASDEIGIHPSTLASPKFLSAILYQKLLPKLCPHCKVPAIGVLSPKTQKVLRDKFLVNPETMFCASTIGCPNCKVAEIGLVGTKGLTVVAEILTPNEEIREAIGERAWAKVQLIWRGLRTTGFDNEDMAGKTAFEHALYKACAGLVDPQDIEADFESFSTYGVFEIKEQENVDWK